MRQDKSILVNSIFLENVVSTLLYTFERCGTWRKMFDNAARTYKSDANSRCKLTLFDVVYKMGTATAVSGDDTS